MRPITAADLMNPHVLTVREDLTVQELASFLLRHQITGAPVEDGHGRLVGVVSVSDIAEASLADSDADADSDHDPDADADPDSDRAGDGYAPARSGRRPLRAEGRSGSPLARSTVSERAAAAWSDRRPGSAPAASPAADAPERTHPQASDSQPEEELEIADEPGHPATEQGAQEELTVRDIMTPAVVSVSEDATVSEVASKMLDGHVHRLVVTRGGQPLGIITTSDLLGLLIDER